MPRLLPRPPRPRRTPGPTPPAITAACPIRHSARWRAVVAGAPREFCCAGCLAVAQTIHAAGLDAFYDRRTVAADRPGDARTTSGRAGTIRRRRPGFVRALPPGGREVALLLEGMHCGACVWLLESLAAAATRRARGERQLRDPPRAGGVRSRRDPRFGGAARRRGGRLSRAPLRSGAAGGIRAPRIPGAVAADERGAAGDDAGDDARVADLRDGRRRRTRAPAAARMGEPDADAPGAPLFGRAVLPRRVARPHPRATGNGRARRPRTRGRVRRQRVGDVRRRRRRLLRLGDDVHRAAARRPLRRARRPPPRRRRDRGGRARAAGDRRAPSGVPPRPATARSSAPPPSPPANSCGCAPARRCPATASWSTAAPPSTRRS